MAHWGAAEALAARRAVGDAGDVEEPAPDEAEEDRDGEEAVEEAQVPEETHLGTRAGMGRVGGVWVGLGGGGGRGRGVCCGGEERAVGSVAAGGWEVAGGAGANAPC